MTFKVFDGIYVGETHKGALKCFCQHGLSLGSDGLEFINRAYQQAAVDTSMHSSRVWFYSHDKETGLDYYTSLDPGGFRFSRPPENEDVVELSEDPDHRFQNELASLADQFGNCADLARETEAARELASGTHSSERDQWLTRFNAIYQKPVVEAQKLLKREIDGLYQELLFEYRLSLPDFSLAMILIQSYVCGAGKVEGENPFRDLTSSVFGIAEHLNEVESIGKANFLKFIDHCVLEASDSRRKALEQSSMTDFHRHSYLALHNLYVALILSSKINSDHSSVTTEEAFCNLLASNEFSCLFYRRHPLGIAKTWAAELIRSGVDEGTYFLKQRYNSVTKPALPNFLFDLFLAFAVYLLDFDSDPEEANLDGILAAERIYSQQHLFAPEVSDWYNFVILNAAKKIGDSEEAKKRALLIAARAVTRQSLGLT